ncbi:hypothetical protein SAMN05192561_102200 [Halopenitus malekzadehii]|uniref:Uncharacterized protein n=1 Tax=Halopenitus malekzadehii TaxID=1267564 RepID=A0A1H6ID97_9EURY|nr:hypothetical protein [Halopenitus malekzadehii]SEH46787.1 hypothetical protein SAMN05192561_102200 [Halopenitus malekzadehii]
MTPGRSRVLTGLVACWLVVAVAVGGVASGAAAAGYQDANAACSSEAASSQFSLLLLLENGDVFGPGTEGAVELYPDTEARLVFCDETTAQPPDSAWNLADTDFLERGDGGDSYYTVRTADVDVETDLTTAIAGNNPEAAGPTLRIVTASESTLSYLEDPVTIRYAGGTGDSSGPVADELAAYNRSLTVVAENRSTLERAANSSAPLSADVTATELATTRSRLNETGETLSVALFASARNGTPGAADGYLAHQDHHDRALVAFEESVDAYLAAAAAEARTARLTAIGVLLGSFVVFGGIGGGIGSWIASRDLQSIRRERRRRSNVGYGWGDLKKAFAIAVLGVIAGLLSSILLGSTLLEVLL